MKQPMNPHPSNAALVGILGGSFDPIHLGHIRLAEAIAEKYSLSKMYLVPASANPLKPDLSAASPLQRLEMAKLAAKETLNPKIHVTDYEVLQKGPSQSLQTVRYLSSEEKAEVVFVMGNEVFASLPQWHRPDEFLRATNVIVVGRTDGIKVDLSAALREVGINDVEILDQAKRIRHSRGAKWVEVADIAVLPYSSTELRLQIARSVSTPDSQMPQGIQRSVWRYIKEYQLYAVK